MSQEQLWEWRAAILQRLAKFRLTIHEDSALPKPVETGIPFLGFVVYPYQRLLKRRKGIAYCRRLKRLLRSGRPVKPSIQGWINHVRYGNTFGLRKAVLARFDLLEDANG